ncbi:MAG: hypothetical protein GXO23_02385 [Crenarchaeota archaeon]|nr:hypothetical protein [Thermoproteota archaeon]
MCAPVSVTTLHVVLTASTLQAWYLSQSLGAVGVVAAIMLGFRNSLSTALRSISPRITSAIRTTIAKLFVR